MTEEEKRAVLREARFQIMDIWEDDELTDEEVLLNILEAAEKALTAVNAGKRGRRRS